MTPMDNDATRPLNDDANTTRSSLGGAETSTEYQADDIILDRYKVIRLLGRGGMGSVYEVEHLNLHGRYALKFLHKTQTNDAAWRRFEIEARATNKLEHPNLIKVHDFGVLPNGQPYFIMDLVEGETLADILKRRGRLSVEQTIKMFIQVGFALSYAHSNGIIHRDIKPSNIIVATSSTDRTENSGNTEDSLVKLVDFGIAKLTGQDGFNQQTLTRTGEIFGSPLYMSPEQCLGIGVDHRTDLYSLGCVMFESLTGSPPLVGDSALATMMKHQNEEPVSLKEASLGVEFPKRIEQVVKRLLAKDLNARYQSAELFTADLVGLDTEQSLTSALNTLPAPIVEKEGWHLSKPVSIVSAASLFAIGFFFGLANPQEKVAEWVDVKPDKQNHQLPPIGVLPTQSSSIPALPDSDATKQIDKDFIAAARIITPFSELKPYNTRVFNFPNFEIGDYHAPGSPQTLPPWTVHNFQGIYFHPNINFRRHPQLFLRFRPDDIRTLNISNTRTFLNLVADNLSDADVLLPFITHLKTIEILGIADSEISAKGMKCIGQLPNLKALNLERSTLNAEDLAKMSNLSHLSLLSVYSLPDARPIINALKTSKNLNILRLISCNVEGKQLEQLANFPSLIELDLSKNPLITDAEMHLVPKHLQTLSLIGCPVSPASTKHLAAMKQLRFLFLDISLWKPEQVNKLQALLPKTAIQIAKEKRRNNFAKNTLDWDSAY
ncbi:MAG: hypothetical protein DKT66_27670 [Candidatus Melainabacteria bacterium]|nr:MAG: hypothetical protein DKT66_27670 [Candidatus Melainabacteria bacterium]